MRLARAGAVVGMAPCLALMLAGTSYADAPSKSGWWNSATANGVALPMPTTAAGDLHVSQGPNAPASYAAVAYDLLGQTISGATLKLKIAPNSTVGTVDVLACPTKDNSWKSGDDQPYDSAPAYNCGIGSKGLVAADGTSVTFLLDAGQLLGGTTFTLAIVPNSKATAPFSVDFVKPDATSLMPDLAPVQQAAAPAPAPAPAAAAPPQSGTSGTAPLSAPVVPAAPVAPLQAPAVAAPAAPAPQTAAAPAAAAPVAAAKPIPVSNRDRYAAGTGLALLAGFLVWAFQQQNPQPRLLGGMARKAGPEALLPVDATPRGIGRFATMRTAPARRLV